MTVSFDLNFWAILAAFSSFALSFASLVMARSKAANDDVRVSEQRIARLSERVTTVEAAVAGFSKDDIVSAHKRLDELLRTTALMEGELKGMSKTLDRLLDETIKRNN